MLCSESKKIVAYGEAAGGGHQDLANTRTHAHSHIRTTCESEEAREKISRERACNEGATRDVTIPGKRTSLGGGRQGGHGRLVGGAHRHTRHHGDGLHLLCVDGVGQDAVTVALGTGSVGHLSERKRGRIVGLGGYLVPT